MQNTSMESDGLNFLESVHELDLLTLKQTLINIKICSFLTSVRLENCIHLNQNPVPCNIQEAIIMAFEWVLKNIFTTQISVVMNMTNRKPFVTEVNPRALHTWYKMQRCVVQLVVENAVWNKVCVGLVRRTVYQTAPFLIPNEGST